MPGDNRRENLDRDSFGAKRPAIYSLDKYQSNPGSNPAPYKRWPEEGGCRFPRSHREISEHVAKPAYNSAFVADRLYTIDGVEYKVEVNTAPCFTRRLPEQSAEQLKRGRAGAHRMPPYLGTLTTYFDRITENYVIFVNENQVPWFNFAVNVYTKSQGEWQELPEFHTDKSMKAAVKVLHKGINAMSGQNDLQDGESSKLFSLLVGADDDNDTDGRLNYCAVDSIYGQGGPWVEGFRMLVESGEKNDVYLQAIPYIKERNKEKDEKTVAKLGGANSKAPAFTVMVDFPSYDYVKESIGVVEVKASHDVLGSVRNAIDGCVADTEFYPYKLEKPVKKSKKTTEADDPFDRYFGDSGSERETKATTHIRPSDVCFGTEAPELDSGSGFDDNNSFGRHDSNGEDAKPAAKDNESKNVSKPEVKSVDVHMGASVRSTTKIELQSVTKQVYDESAVKSIHFDFMDAEVLAAYPDRFLDCGVSPKSDLGGEAKHSQPLLRQRAVMGGGTRMPLPADHFGDRPLPQLIARPGFCDAKPNGNDNPEHIRIKQNLVEACMNNVACQFESLQTRFSAYIDAKHNREMCDKHYAKSKDPVDRVKFYFIHALSAAVDKLIKELRPTISDKIDEKLAKLKSSGRDKETFSLVRQLADEINGAVKDVCRDVLDEAIAAVRTKHNDDAKKKCHEDVYAFYDNSGPRAFEEKILSKGIMSKKVRGMIRDYRRVASEPVLTMSDCCNVVIAVKPDRQAPRGGGGGGGGGGRGGLFDDKGGLVKPTAPSKPTKKSRCVIS